MTLVLFNATSKLGVWGRVLFLAFVNRRSLFASLYLKKRGGSMTRLEGVQRWRERERGDKRDDGWVDYI